MAMSRNEISKRYRDSPKGQKYHKKYYEANKEAVKKRAVERRKRVWAENRKTFDAYKAREGCATCLEDDARCLDFHHLDPRLKSFVIAECYYKNPSRLWEEVAKCSVLCANCHRKFHSKED